MLRALLLRKTPSNPLRSLDVYKILLFIHLLLFSNNRQQGNGNALKGTQQETVVCIEFDETIGGGEDYRGVDGEMKIYHKICDENTS